MAKHQVTFCVECHGTFEEPQPFDAEIKCSCGAHFLVRSYADTPNPKDDE